MGRRSQRQPGRGRERQVAEGRRVQQQQFALVAGAARRQRRRQQVRLVDGGRLQAGAFGEEQKEVRVVIDVGQGQHAVSFGDEPDSRQAGGIAMHGPHLQGQGQILQVFESCGQLGGAVIEAFLHPDVGQGRGRRQGGGDALRLGGVTAADEKLFALADAVKGREGRQQAFALVIAEALRQVQRVPYAALLGSGRPDEGQGCGQTAEQNSSG